MMKRMMLLWAMTVALAGCNGFLLSPPKNDPPPTDKPSTSNLKPFASEQEFVQYVTNQLSVRNSLYMAVSGEAVGLPGSAGAIPPADIDADYASESPAVPEPAPDSLPIDNRDHSDTTTQEHGVAEADVVKTDGSFLYIMSSQTLRIVRIEPREQMAEVRTLELPAFGADLYVEGGVLVAISQEWGGYYYEHPIIDPPQFEADDFIGSVDAGGGDSSLPRPGVAVGGTEPAHGADVDGAVISVPDISSPPEYRRPQTFVTIVDLANRSDARPVATFNFDGTLSTSRMIGSQLHLVTSMYADYYADVAPMIGRQELNAQAVDPRVLLPRFERRNGEGLLTASGDLLDWRRLYRPLEGDGVGMTVVISMNVANPGEAVRSVGIVADPGLVYSTVDAMYVTDSIYSGAGSLREQTQIYQLVYGADGAQPYAGGSVEGRILNQYSMSEHNGHLRVATTSIGAGNAGPANNVYVLDARLGRDPAQLDVVGALEGLAPGETIQSARFMGDRGYVVTFRQVDPLFTIDLADPRNPRMVGELKVPGFSTFIVPMGENHLLTVGQFVPEPGDESPAGIQLSVFDVSDFARPKLAHLAVIDQGNHVWSEAIWNPKAFTYFAAQGLVALPIYSEEPYVHPPHIDLPFFPEAPPSEVLPDGGDMSAVIDQLMQDPMVAALIGALAGSNDPSLEDLAAILADMGLLDEADWSGVSGPSSDGGWSDFDVPDISLGDWPFVDTYQPPVSFEGIVIFRVDAASGFTELGRISTRFAEHLWSFASFTRAVFVGNDAFAVTDVGVRGAPLNTLDEVIYEVDFEAIPDGVYPSIK